MKFYGSLTITKHTVFSFAPNSMKMIDVLVVEDLKEDRLIIKKKLTTGYQVTTLSSAIEAKAFARIHKFDVALLNVRLRDDLDCIELLRDLETISENSFIPIAITSYVDDARFQRIMQAGFKAVIKKPFNKDEFDWLIKCAYYKIAG